MSESADADRSPESFPPKAVARYPILRWGTALFFWSLGGFSLLVGTIHLVSLLKPLVIPQEENSIDVLPVNFQWEPTARNFLGAGLRMAGGLCGIAAGFASRKGSWWTALWRVALLFGLITVSSALIFFWF